MAVLLPPIPLCISLKASLTDSLIDCNFDLICKFDLTQLNCKMCRHSACSASRSILVAFWLPRQQMIKVGLCHCAPALYHFEYISPIVESCSICYTCKRQAGIGESINRADEPFAGFGLNSTRFAVLLNLLSQT